MKQLFKQDNEKKEPIIVRHLLKPLLYRGNNICTVSVYVFIESFESLKCHIFNNVKARFRRQADYSNDEDFKLSGLGKGPTLIRYSLKELMKLLNKQASS